MLVLKHRIEYCGDEIITGTMNIRINHVAVWILIVVYFLIGWGWYAIFGNSWLNLRAKTMTDIERTHNVSAYVLAFVTSIVVNYTLAVLIARTNLKGP